MLPIIISREQFEKIKRVFDEYDIDEITLTEEHISGIGANVYLEFDPKTKVKIDITDYGTW